MVDHPARMDAKTPDSHRLFRIGSLRYCGTLESFLPSRLFELRPLGEYDGVAICEFPNNTAAVACSMSATATGGFSRFETTTLLTAQEAEAAMKQANQTKTEYKPPGWGGSPI